MQLHEKRHMKRAGEAGEVLRATGKTGSILLSCCTETSLSLSRLCIKLFLYKTRTVFVYRSRF
ncbi:hypothetical protein DMW53_18305 [Serratia marcescens]|nr:hypothetical protein DMW53_18305 [Serratia marcescens]PYB16313.1 hypothetical protein DMW55_17955 [Serratia marcescens]